MFDTPSGHLTSPGYPIQYGNNLNCNYTIKTPGQDFIVAKFVEIFNIEKGKFFIMLRQSNQLCFNLGRSNCNYDRVNIVEMSSNASRGEYCGDETPPIVSTRGGMIVNFVTDSSIPKKGFKLEWTTHQCGGSLTEEGEIR